MSQLRYKQLSRHYGAFYVDFLKVNVKSLREYIGGMLYCNKLGFEKFFPCVNETQEDTSHSLRSFIEIVGGRAYSKRRLGSLEFGVPSPSPGPHGKIEQSMPLEK